MTDAAAGTMTRLYIVHEPEHIAKIQDHLSSARIIVSGANRRGDIALAEIAELKPDVVVVNVHHEDMPVVDLIRTVRAQGAAVVAAAYVEASAELQRKCYKADAFDVMNIPSVKRLEETIIRAHESELAKAGGPAKSAAPRATELVFGRGEGTVFESEQNDRGRVICVYSPKNAVGRATVAVNLALAMAQENNGSVCLADFNLRSGEIDLTLSGLDPSENHTVGGVAQQSAGSRRVNEAALIRAVQPGPCGIDVLLAPATVESSMQIIRGQLTEIQTLLREQYRHVVANVASSLNEHTIDALSDADEILVVMTPEFASIKNTLLFLDFAGKLQLAQDRIRLILHRADPRLEKEVDFEKLAERLKGREFVARLSERPGTPEVLFGLTDPAVLKATAKYRDEYLALVRKLAPVTGKARLEAAVGLTGR